MVHVAIIIVHYNNDQDTRACLDSLRKIKRKSYTVSTVVVDNGSKDALIIPQKQLPKNTVIVRSDTNLGFTDGNNLGIEYVAREKKPDYILILNNDTTQDEEFLTKLIACAESSEKVGMITPKIYFAPGNEYHHASYTPSQKGKVLWYAGGSIDWANLDAFHRGVDELDRGHFDQAQETDFATGCCVLMPYSVIEKVGVLEGKYFLYLEDVDWSIRVRQAGFKVLYAPDAKVWHANASSSGGAGSELNRYYQTRNRFYFFLRYSYSMQELQKMHNPLATKTKKIPKPAWKAVPEIFFFQANIFRLALRFLVLGDATERRATIDFLLGRMGKQTII